MTTGSHRSSVSATASIDGNVFLYAFDLIELNGNDLRRDPLQVRKATLASIVAKARPGIRFNEHIEGDGPTVFAHACKMGLEGIVSKRKDSTYRSGRSPDWLKMKNADAPAMKREVEEDGERAVTELERKHLVETDRHIAECEAYIAKQRDLIERAIQQGRSTEVAEETLEALEASLRALERQRQRLLDRLKSESR
jgi:ATP-dependent DNA ligase